MADRIAAFEAMLERGQDSALLRFSLGSEYLGDGNPEAAIQHLRLAVEQDPSYSAAWKLLGKSLADAGDQRGAADAYRRGIDAATAKGDRQAAKEMQVFLRRIEKAARGE